MLSSIFLETDVFILKFKFFVGLAHKRLKDVANEFGSLSKLDMLL